MSQKQREKYEEEERVRQLEEDKAHRELEAKVKREREEKKNNNEEKKVLEQVNLDLEALIQKQLDEFLSTCESLEAGLTKIHDLCSNFAIDLGNSNDYIKSHPEASKNR
eukprot:UN20296